MILSRCGKRCSKEVLARMIRANPVDVQVVGEFEVVGGHDS